MEAKRDSVLAHNVHGLFSLRNDRCNTRYGKRKWRLDGGTRRQAGARIPWGTREGAAYHHEGVRWCG